MVSFKINKTGARGFLSCMSLSYSERYFTQHGGSNRRIFLNNETIIFYIRAGEIFNNFDRNQNNRH